MKHLTLLIILITGCINAREFQPVSKKSLERDPTKRPTYIENQYYMKDNYIDKTTKNLPLGFTTKNLGCNQTLVGNETVLLPISTGCRGFDNYLYLQFNCKKEVDGWKVGPTPARFKTVEIRISFKDSSGHADEKRITSQTNHTGLWSTSFHTKDEISDTRIYLLLKGQEIPLISDQLPVDLAEFCSP